jgi:hypothetical protein
MSLLLRDLSPGLQTDRTGPRIIDEQSLVVRPCFGADRPVLRPAQRSHCHEHGRAHKPMLFGPKPEDERLRARRAGVSSDLSQVSTPGAE